MSTVIEPQATTSVDPVYVDDTAQNVHQEIETYDVGDYVFYPDYGDKGSTIVCRDDGNAPDWIASDMMKQSRFECCTNYYFSSSWSGSCNLESPFYAKFEDKRCVNDGNQPDWMTGDYLHDTLWRCCHNS